MNPPQQARLRYYRTGALGLRALQDRGFGAQRFSPDADARWKAFKGELTDSDRLDLLLRDGAVPYPVAFSPAVVFDLPDLATDEPFGPEWESLRPSDAGPILREARDKPEASESLLEFLKMAADVWGLTPSPPQTGDASHIQAASRIILAGAGAIIAVAEHMAPRTDTDLGDQVLLVTDAPGERQLLGLAAALTGSRTRPRLVTPENGEAQAQAQGFTRATFLLMSQDASAASREAATALAASLGA